MNERSESESSSVQVNSQNNYKYDKYGFVLVNSIEDLLYDKFNYYMGKDINNKKNKNDKDDNGHVNNSNSYRNYLGNQSKRGKKNKENINDSMKIILNINNKEKKILKINPNDSKSIDTMTMKDTDTKNNNSTKNNKFNNKYINKTNRNKKKENYKKEKYLSHKRDNENYDEDYEKDEQFTFCDNENKKNESSRRKKKKKYKSKKSIDSKDLENISENEDEVDIYDPNNKSRKSKPKNMKKNSIKNKNNFYYYSLPILNPCVMSKIRKENQNIMQTVPKSSREFITKTYENERNKKILTWPNSSICYFNRTNKIINVNIHIPMQNVTNKNYFCTKEIIDSHNIKNIQNKRLSKNSSLNKDSSNIIIKIVNPENSPFKYGKINIRTGSGKNSNSKNKSYVFKIRGNHDKKNVKKMLFKNNSALSRSKCLKNKEIRSALNIKKSKSKSRGKKKKLSPECITLKRRRRFGDKIYKKIMKKKALYNPQEYQISIKTKFRNNLLDNYKSFKNNEKKEEEKMVRNNSMNRFDLNNINKNKILLYPYIKKTINDENFKNRSIPLISDQRGNPGFNTIGKYNLYYTNNLKIKSNNNNNYNNDFQNFPAINSYFH